MLAALGGGDVLLTRRDGLNLVLTTEDRTRAIRDGLMTLARVVLEAVEQPDAASGVGRHLGAVRDHARVASRLHELGARTPIALVRARPVSGWKALTPAELDVVRLAAEGLTNREIGARLFVSHRTVATHLSHVFDKLGLRSRVELAREAARRADEPKT